MSFLSNVYNDLPETTSKKDSIEFFDYLKNEKDSFLKSFFTNPNISFAYVNLQGFLEFVSENNLKPFQLNPSINSNTSKKILWSTLWPTDLKPITQNALKEAFKKSSSTFKFIYKNSEAYEEVYKVVLSPHLNAKGKVLGVIITGYDATALPRSQQSLKSELNDFVYSVAHDLKAPVRHTASFTEILVSELGKENIPEEAKECIDSILHANDSMKVLIEGLLNIARTTTNENAFEKFEAREIIEDVLCLFKSELEKNQFKVENTVKVSVNYDQSLFSKVIQNLIDNAIKFSKPGKSTLSINAEIDQTGELVFSVKDNGTGIASDFKPLVFKAFQSMGLNRIQSATSSGIGLAICKRIIEGNGGRIWFDSNEGEGCSFFFKLHTLQ